MPNEGACPQLHPCLCRQLSIENKAEIIDFDIIRLTSKLNFIEIKTEIFDLKFLVCSAGSVGEELLPNVLTKDS